MHKPIGGVRRGQTIHPVHSTFVLTAAHRVSQQIAARPIPVVAQCTEALSPLSPASPSLRRRLG